MSLLRFSYNGYRQFSYNQKSLFSAYATKEVVNITVVNDNLCNLKKNNSFSMLYSERIFIFHVF